MAFLGSFRVKGWENGGKRADFGDKKWKWGCEEKVDDESEKLDDGEYFTVG